MIVRIAHARLPPDAVDDRKTRDHHVLFADEYPTYARHSVVDSLSEHCIPSHTVARQAISRGRRSAVACSRRNGGGTVSVIIEATPDAAAATPVPARRSRRRWRRRALITLLQLLLLAAVLGAWQLCASQGWVDKLFSSEP